jgi:hypothetical protein
MKAPLLVLLLALVLGTSNVFADHHHGHVNKQYLNYYVTNMQVSIERLETVLGSCSFTPGIDHALGDAEELCELTSRFSQSANSFQSTKGSLQVEFGAMAELAAHIDDLVEADCSLHGVCCINTHVSHINWYMHQIAQLLGVSYVHD